MKKGKATKASTPAALGKAIDELHKIRARKLEYGRLYDTWAGKQEKQATVVLNLLQAADLMAARGRKCTASRKKVSVVGAGTDWTKVHEYIRKTGNFELLQKRFGMEALRERWDAGEQIPGVNREQKFELNLSAK